NGVSITTPFIGSPKSYWLKAVNGTTGCETTLQEVRALVYPEPGLPVVSDTSRCGTGAISLPSQPGSDANTSRWYTTFSGGTLLEENNNYTTPFLNAGNYTYWVSSYNTFTSCESERNRLDVDIFPVPGPNPIVGDNVVPVGEPNALYSMNANSGSVYEWFIPSGVDTGLINNNYVILSFPDTGNYQLVGRETNIYGCPGPLQNKLIEVSDSVFRVNLSSKYPQVCAGEDLTVTSMPTGGTPSFSFAWWGDTTFATSINAGDIDFNAPTAGNYTLYVKVTDVNFKEAFDTVFITVYPNPNISMAISDSIVCAGSSEILNTNVTGGSSPYTAYSWSGSTDPLTSVTSGNPTFNTNTKGFYPLHVEVTDSEGCKNNASITIKNELPIALFEASDPDPCSPAPYTFTNNSVDAVSYNWDFGDGSSAVNDTHPTHEYVNTGSSIQYYNVELTAFSENGCMNTSTQTVLTYPNPANTIEMEPEVACDPAEVLLYGNPGNYQYHWDFGDGVSLTSGYSINHIFTNNGFNDTTYQVQLISESSLGCLDTATRNVTVYPSPQADFEVIPQVMNYPDSVANITNLTDDRNWNYQWDFDDQHTSLERDPQEHIYAAPGTYDIQLRVSGEHCSDSITRMLRINPAAPIAKFAPVDPGCEPHTVTFENNTQFADSYLWEFGDGSVSNKPNPTYTYYEFGKYNIRLTVEGSGGMDTASQETEVYILPRAEFRASPRQVFVNDRPVQFFNTSVNADSYLWDFGDNTTSTRQEPEHIYKKEGQFTVQLTVSTENNCFDTYELENAVLVEPSGKILYPNVFRPSSPTPERSIFKPAIIDEVDEYHLMIFNRWGELIFESHSIDQGWDGRVNGSIAPQDVYVWKVKGTYISGQSFVKSGDVTLMR
ncbi:MAG: PKD domain-containing protein, partial [Bacteroidetes bacterium]|nr:PKD domain-containing protein [Bacteroidota bacterium]